jgi:hypothetical protein
MKNFAGFVERSWWLVYQLVKNVEKSIIRFTTTASSVVKNLRDKILIASHFWGD